MVKNEDSALSIALIEKNNPKRCAWAMLHFPLKTPSNISGVFPSHLYFVPTFSPYSLCDHKSLNVRFLIAERSAFFDLA